MEDVFNNETFLLYSPGINLSLQESHPLLWFNLITFNGECWQTYGPISAYTSFEPDDIYFFASELNTEIIEEQDILDDVENNPIPYMMLWSGSSLPIIINKDEQLINAVAEYDLDSFEPKIFKDSFKVEYNRDVYRLSLKTMSGPPHYAEAYFDENKKAVLLSAMTNNGFRLLAETLNKYGYFFDTEPSARVNLSMIETASEILKKKIRLNEYDNLFSKEPSPEVKGQLDKMNYLMKLLLPDINAGREPDLKALAAQAGVDSETAKNIYATVMKKFGK